MTNKYLSLWAINDALDTDALTRQLELMQSCGIEGVIFHPRYYPGVPEYMSAEYMKILSEVILYAKRLGMEFWIYDENGWPSGTADGQVIAECPELRKRYVELRSVREPISGEDVLIKRYGEYNIVLVSEVAPSTIDLKATMKFIELTHEKYKNMLDKEAFAYVTGFFSDEVCLPHNDENSPYSSAPYIGEGYAWEELFFDVGDYRRTRIEFCRAAAKALAENFYRPINEWCLKNGKLFTAHLKGEENPAFSIPFNGSPFVVLREVRIPCVDALERNVPNNYFPRIAASIAAEFGDGNCMCEALGGSGWGLDPEHMTRFINQLAKCGINTYAMHVQQLKLDTDAAKDWPPSQPLDLSWHDAYADTLAGIDAANQHADTLIVAPIRGVSARYRWTEREQTNIHNGSCQPRTPATAASRDFADMCEHTDGFHVTDENILEEHLICGNGEYILGKCTYRRLIIDKACLFERRPEQTQFNVTRPCDNVFIHADGSVTKGDFLVIAEKNYEDLGDVLSVPYEFRLHSDGDIDAHDLIRSGLVFTASPVEMKKDFVLDRDYVNPLYFFEDFYADCARVYIDDTDMGFYISGRENKIKGRLSSGAHRLRLLLYPSTFNLYGPHNHIDGDVRVCSPMQFTGVKNFADRADAPENTRSDNINVKKFGVGDFVVIG